MQTLATQGGKCLVSIEAFVGCADSGFVQLKYLRMRFATKMLLINTQI